HPSLTALRDVLVRLFPRRDESEIVVDEAGIPRERVRFSEQSDVNWHEILKVAERMSRVPVLIEVALGRYPGNLELRQAVDGYRSVFVAKASPAVEATSVPDSKLPAS